MIGAFLSHIYSLSDIEVEHRQHIHVDALAHLPEWSIIGTLQVA